MTSHFSRFIHLSRTEANRGKQACILWLLSQKNGVWLSSLYTWPDVHTPLCHNTILDVFFGPFKVNALSLGWVAHTLCTVNILRKINALCTINTLCTLNAQDFELQFLLSPPPFKKYSLYKNIAGGLSLFVIAAMSCRMHRMCRKEEERNKNHPSYNVAMSNSLFKDGYVFLTNNYHLFSTLII